MDRTVVLTQGSIPRQLIWLALPLICGNILQQLYNTVDAFIIGRFLGGAAFGAVGVAGTVMNLFIFILSGCCTGIAVLFAQFYGSRDLASFRREGFLSLVFGLLLTAVLGLGGLVLLGPLLGLIQTPGELRPLVTEYLNVIFLGLPVTFLYNLGSAALRAAGSLRRKISVDLLEAHILLAGGDPASVAVAYGSANAVIGMVLPLLEQNFHIRRRDIRTAVDFEKPHSEIRGSTAICAFPRLFAAYHVLLRSREPRHPPCALDYYLFPIRRRMSSYTYCSFSIMSMCVWTFCPGGE